MVSNGIQSYHMLQEGREYRTSILSSFSYFFIFTSFNSVLTTRTRLVPEMKRAMTIALFVVVQS